jgi:hypothetical protein
MRNRFFAGLILMLISGFVSAQDMELPQLSGFKKVTSYPVFKPANLWNFINGAANTYLAYGFIDLHVAEYKKGKNTIKAEVYRHSDNTMAFGIYSAERSPSFRFMKLGTQGYIVDGAVNFFKGNYYVKIRTFSKSEKIIQATQSLALKIAGMLDGTSEMPAILSMFPEQGKKLNEETYINESVLGHKFLNNAFKATYELGPDNFSVFIMKCGSSPEVRKTINEYLVSAETDTTDSESGRYMLKDGYNGTVFLAWKETFIVIISGLSKDQSEIADQYTTEIFK